MSEKMLHFTAKSIKQFSTRARDEMDFGEQAFHDARGAKTKNTHNLFKSHTHHHLFTTICDDAEMAIQFLQSFICCCPLSLLICLQM